MPKITDRILLHMLALSGQQMVICSANGDVVDCSLLIARKVGLSTSKLIGRSFFSFAKVEGAYLPELCELVPDNTPQEVILQLSSKGATPDIYECKIVKSNGFLGFFLAVQSDIHESAEKGAHQCVIESGYRFFSDIVSEVILRVTRKGEILFSSKEWVRNINYNGATNIFSVIAEPFKADVASALIAGKPHKLDIQVLTKENELCWFELSVEDMSTQSQINKARASIPYEQDYCVIKLHNINQRILNTMALEEEKKRAEALAQTKTRFMASISHEIRTPLNAILGASELLSDSGLTPDQAEFSHLIQVSGKSLLNIVDDVLFYSRSEERGIELSNERFSLIDSIEHVFSVVESLAFKKQLSLVCDITSTCPLYFLGDENRFKQIILNLVTNAIKFTDKGWVLVRCSINENLIVEIEDTGLGIDSNYINTLFKPFVQGDNSIKRRVGGSGLGLAICHQIVTAMKGSITVRSKVNEGSCFSLSLPFEKVCEAKPKKETTEISFVICCEIKPIADALFNFITRAGHTVEFEHSSDLNINTHYKNTHFIFHCGGSQALAFAQQLSQDNLVLFINSKRDTSFEKDLRENVHFVEGPITPFLLGKAHQKFEEELRDFGLQAYANYKLHDVKNTVSRDYNGVAILLVEDNVNNQFVACQFLEKYNCKVTIAENGLEALEHMRQAVFELVLMDIHMPIMDGIEATRVIRGQAKHAALPIVAVTANALEGDKEMFLQIGMNDYLPKPIKIESLVAVLDKYVGTRNQARMKSEHIENANLWVSSLLNR